MRRCVIAVLVYVSLCRAPARADPADPPSVVVVVADIVSAHRAGRRCRLRLRVVAIERGARHGVAVGGVVAATTSCHPYAMHRMHGGGRFRFELRWRSSVPDARVIGARLRDQGG